MRFKIIFGIILPLLIIISLTFVVNLGQVSVKKDFIKQIVLNELFENGNIKDSIKVGSITISNNYYLPKREDLKVLGVCLRDTKGNVQITEAGTLEYSEGDIPYNKDYKYTPQDRSVQIKGGETKTVQVYIRPSYDFNYLNSTQLLDRYGDYDELVIFEKDDSPNNYPYTNHRNYYCTDLDSDALNNAVHIKLVL